MKKYALAASLFLFNCEIISWIALIILVVMGAMDFFFAMERERGKR